MSKIQKIYLRNCKIKREMLWAHQQSLWKILEDAKQAEDEAVHISVTELLFYVEQIILLLGQSSNAITYHRRLNVLRCIMNSQYQVKTMLKEKTALLQKHGSELFGKKFRNHIADTMKSKRETREIFTDSKKPFPWSPSYPPRRVKSFSHQRRRIELRKIQ